MSEDQELQAFEEEFKNLQAPDYEILATAKFNFNSQVKASLKDTLARYL